MNVELIRARLKDGFRPFAIVTSSGNKYAVPHPEFILITQRTVVVADHRVRHGFGSALYRWPGRRASQAQWQVEVGAKTLMQPDASI